MSTEASTEAPAETPDPVVRPDADRLAELEEERRFLLRSLADLQREHDAGDVDEHDYTALRDGYTARAVVVLREIDGHHAALAQSRPGRFKRITVTSLAVVVLSGMIGFLVVHYAAPRGSGGSISGGLPTDQVAGLLSDGRLGLLQSSDYATAIAKYKAVLDIQRDNPEALAYSGWTIALIAQGQPEQAASMLGVGKETLQKAIAADATYADPYCLLSLVSGLFEHDVPSAVTYEGQCLARDPSSDLKQLVQQSIDPLKPGGTTGSTTATTGG